MIAAHDALTIAAAVLLPGAAVFSARVAFTTWRTTRRRAARGHVRIIDSVRRVR